MTPQIVYLTSWFVDMMLPDRKQYNNKLTAGNDVLRHHRNNSRVSVKNVLKLKMLVIESLVLTPSRFNSYASEHQAVGHYRNIQRLLVNYFP